ncbi:salicylate synthase [Tepidibacter hydrothermalis]|uniref:Salicylate synthase n=1 Tax=Tepidibacter hydrothermalis TaxID=3036126 RepID=A0ABY8EFW1_9FIRM|nr:salicylate synthase [Tepidibacter hydrothermalis]WFD11840.1 salicylate synthase [Tepidibacter hydrothermalis]
MKNQIKDFLYEDQSSKYIKKELKIDCSGFDLNNLGIELCENIFNYDYVMYERGDEISIGIGKKVDVISMPNQIMLKKQDKTIKVDMKDINEDLHSVFKCIPFDNWRVYGIARFGLAYHNYKIPLKHENPKILELFIPEIDIRLKDYYASIKAFDQKYINIAVEAIQNFEQRQACILNEKEKNKCILDTSLKEQKAKEYEDMVATAVEDIDSEKYQKVIISRKVQVDKKISMPKSYLLGRKVNTPARSYCLKIDGLRVIGYSPETVAEIDRHKTVFTFPLAGTRAIEESKIETEKLRQELLADPKEIAEHAVSVKLAYEELEKVCKEKSVYVTEFMDVLERGTVQHLASRLKGEISDGLNEWHAFNMLFPAVTASGIPKRECLEAISRIETDSRDLYSGSVLTYDQDGSLDAALVLRSVYQDDQTTWLRAGAGIVKLSKPERELEETREKLSSVSRQLIEC